MESLDIVIAGAGMGGLTAAIALQQAGHRVRLYERTAQLAPAGAAISIWPNGVKVLGALGLGGQIAAASGEMRTMSYHDSSGQLLTRFSLEPLYAMAGEPARPIARAALQRILLGAARQENVILGVAVEGFEDHPEGVTVALSDGTTTRADLLIAADGTHSRLRNQVNGQDIGRDYCGYVNWNGRVPIDDVLGDAREWSQYVGDHKRVSLMPMGNHEFYFFFDVPLPRGTANERSAYRRELGEHFAGWAEPVRHLIETLDPANVARVEIHDTAPLDRLTRGRVALLGDSAHAMAPDLGQGGCQAMEDAWVLAEAISRATSMEEALRRYAEARHGRVNEIVRRARARAETTHGHDPEQTRQWYAGLSQESGEGIIAGLVKTVRGGPL